MAGMGNDSLGKFFLVAVDNAADLAAGTSAYYVAVSYDFFLSFVVFGPLAN